MAGLKLRALEAARLAGADAVVNDVRQSVRTTTNHATATIKLATDLADRFPLIGAALNEGTISEAQAHGIVAGLRKLPKRFTRAQLEQGQETILGHAETFGPAELRILAARLTEVLDPDTAEADEAARLAAEERAAQRDRFVTLTPDYHGSMQISGKLPVADAAQLKAQLEALMPPASSYRDADELPTRAMRRADALMRLVNIAAANGDLPNHGGIRPHVHVTVKLESLLTGLGRIGLFGIDGVEGISPGEARRLACDADIIPVVLDGESRPLDVGRDKRLFTDAMRTALTERDKGCAFPGCTATPAASEAHHIVPWWAGGETSIHNGVLLCPHHHRLVEPDPGQSPESQWEVHLDAETALPWFTPPRHIDPRRRPRQHRRFMLRTVEPPDGEPPCPPPDPDTTTAPGQRPRPDLEERIRRSAEIWGTPPTPPPPRPTAAAAPTGTRA